MTDHFKILGEIEKADGIGVLGRNTAGSGETYGVKGEVQSADGYGLYTPDDARVDGVVTSDDGNWVVEVEDGFDAGNIRQGDPSNAVDADEEGQTVGGGEENETGNSFATVAGGVGNEASGRYASIGGGENNVAAAEYATVAGGGQATWETHTVNRVFDRFGTVGGGGNNQVGLEADDAAYGTVAGGMHNDATGESASIGGGWLNTASGAASAVPGGEENAAEGDYSFAAGRRATAATDGSFVWSDSSDSSISSSDDDQFIVDAGNGVGVGTSSPNGTLHLKANQTTRSLILEEPDGPEGWSLAVEDDGNLSFWQGNVAQLSIANRAEIDGDTGQYSASSDRRVKRDVEYLDGVLDEILALQPATYRPADGDEESGRHYGFIAQEVRDVFPDIVTGDEEDGILGLTYDGFAVLAIQAIKEQQEVIEDHVTGRRERESTTDGVHEDLADTDRRVDDLEREIERKEERIEELEAESERTDKLTAELAERFATLEAQVDGNGVTPADD